MLQSLFMMGRDPEVSPEEAVTSYRNSLDSSQSLYLFNLFNIIKTAEFALEDTERKRAKYLPSDEDKKFTAKLYENEVIQALVRETHLQEVFEEKGLSDLLEEDTARNYYKTFAKTDEYKKYVQNEDGLESHREAVLSMYRLLVKSEIFEENMEDHFPTWEDDRSLIIGAVKKTVKALPQTPELYRTFRPDYEAAVEFGEAMLSQVIEDHKGLEGIIAPALENWDIERVANIDMILLKMALCEFLHFSSIPTKVTLNEYVEISKMYSTDKSKDFINGILDKLMKQLKEEGKIQKSGRGLQD